MNLLPTRPTRPAEAPLRIPGEAIWLVDAMAGRQILAVDLCDVENLQRFSQELPEISVAQSALDHVTGWGLGGLVGGFNKYIYI